MHKTPVDQIAMSRHTLSKRMKNYYVLFDDSKTAVSFYAEIKKVGVQCTMAPTPRTADACCGVAILYYHAIDKTIIEETAKATYTRIKKFWDCENENNPDRNKFC